MKKRKAIATMLSIVLFAPTLFSCNDNSSNSNNPIFHLTATIENLEEKILIEVTEGEYASGPYLVITSDKTEFIGKDGKKITRNDLSIGDTVKITYNGQVMMSYPAQIAALKIELK